MTRFVAQGIEILSNNRHIVFGYVLTMGKALRDIKHEQNYVSRQSLKEFFESEEYKVFNKLVKDKKDRITGKLKEDLIVKAQRLTRYLEVDETSLADRQARNHEYMGTFGENGNNLDESIQAFMKEK